MGQFKIEITAVGGHGVDRTKKDGEEVDFFEEGSETADAMAKSLVESLISLGYNVEEAKLISWPGEEGSIEDNLITGIRKGNF